MVEFLYFQEVNLMTVGGNFSSEYMFSHLLCDCQKTNNQ
jgi:hypothetical protein